MNKLSPIGFEIAASTYLEGTNLLELLVGIKLEKDEEGFIKEHIFKNLKTALKVAADEAPDVTVSAKCRKMLDFMGDYYK